MLRLLGLLFTALLGGRRGQHRGAPWQNGNATGALDRFAQTAWQAQQAFSAAAGAASLLGKQQMEFAKSLSIYNGKIGAAVAGEQGADIRRNILMGAQTQESTVKMVKAMTELKDSFRPVAAEMQNIMNHMAANAAGWLSKLSDKMREWLEKWWGLAPGTLKNPMGKPGEANLGIYGRELVHMGRDATNLTHPSPTNQLPRRRPWNPNNPGKGGLPGP